MTNRAEIRMAELGVQPILVEDSVAAAACGLSVERFRAVCPVKPAQVGRKRLVPLDDVKTWAKGWWRTQTGTRAANDTGAPGKAYWQSQLEAEDED